MNNLSSKQLREPIIRAISDVRQSMESDQLACLNTDEAFRRLEAVLLQTGGDCADELEELRKQNGYWADRVAAVERVADMAQDDEDGNGWVPVEPLLDALYPNRRKGDAL